MLRFLYKHNRVLNNNLGDVKYQYHLLYIFNSIHKIETKNLKHSVYTSYIAYIMYNECYSQTLLKRNLAKRREDFS